MTTTQRQLRDYATQVPPLLDALACLANCFATYDRVPTTLDRVSDAPGVFIRTKCSPPVYYRDKTKARMDDHWDDPVWLKRLLPWRDNFEDPWSTAGSTATRKTTASAQPTTRTEAGPRTPLILI